MIQHKLIRTAFYVFVGILIVADAFFLFQGLTHPEMLTHSDSPWSIRNSQGRWVAYHAWSIVMMGILVYAELMKKRGLFLLGLLISFILFYYPFFTE